MNDLYVIRNQHDQYLDKHGEWVDQAEGSVLYRTGHKDEAINTKVEHSVRHPDLRLAIVPCTLDERGRLLVKETASDSRLTIDRTPECSFTAGENSRDESVESRTLKQTFEVEQPAASGNSDP